MQTKTMEETRTAEMTDQTETMQERVNGFDTEALKRTMDRIATDPSAGTARFQVTTAWMGGTRSETRVEGWQIGGERRPKSFRIAMDEPPELFGTNTAANPQEFLMAAVNACMMATYVGACSVKGIEVESLEIEMTGELNLRGFLGMDRKVKPGYDEIQYTVRIRGRGTPEQFEEVHKWVMATSPNYWNMANPVRMKPTLVVM